MPKNDFTASGGIDLAQWRKDIDTLISETARGAKAVESLDTKTSVAGKTFSTVFKAATVVGFASAVTSELAGVNVAVGDTNKVLGQLKLSAFGDEVPEGFDRAKNALADFTEGTTNLIRQLPVVGGAIADAAGAAKKYSEDELRIAVATDKESESADALVQKLRDLRAARTTEFAKGPGFRNEDSIARLNAAISDTSRKYVDAANRELDAGKANEAGQAQRIALAQLEIEKRQKIAALSESLKNEIGGKGAAGNEIYEAGVKRIEREIDLKRRSIELSKTQEEVQTNLNEIAETTGIEYGEQLNLQREKIAANSIEVDKAEKLYGTHSLIASQLRVQHHELELAAQEMEHQHASALEAAKDATSALDAQLAGNKTLAQLEANRVANAQKIRDALRAGNPQLAEQIAKQQTLSDLDAKAKQLRRKPSEIRAERKEQEAQDAAIRHINAIEKNNPNSVPADGRRHISPAAARARAEFAARHAIPIVRAAQQQLQDIKANTIVVQQIKPG